MIDDIKKTLWATADKLRANMDAAEYKHVLLGLKVGWGSTGFVVLRPKPPLPPNRAYLLCRYGKFREFAVQSMAGTSGRQRVQTDVLGRYLVARLISGQLHLPNAEALIEEAK